MEIKIDNLTPEQIDVIKTQIAEYEKENEKPKDVIDYEHGWVIVNNKARQTVEFSNETIRKIHSIGLYRDTQEEAEKLLRKMQIEHRLRQWAKMCREKVEYFNTSQKKFYVRINSDLEVMIDCTMFAYRNNIYFTDRQVLKRAIEDIGEHNLIDNYFVEV